jgi:hypothetical protein
MSPRITRFLRSNTAALSPAVFVDTAMTLRFVCGTK